VPCGGGPESQSASVDATSRESESSESVHESEYGDDLSPTLTLGDELCSTLTQVMRRLTVVIAAYNCASLT
jgi:hypothetical protein